MRILNYFACVVGLMLLVCCGSPESGLAKLDADPTIEGYETFIEKYPESELVETAKSRIAEIGNWNAIKSITEINVYEAHMEDFPQGLFHEIAGRRAEEIATYRDAESRDIIVSYEDFLSQYPDSQFGKECEQRINDLQEAAAAYGALTGESEMASQRDFVVNYADTGYARSIYERMLGEAMLRAEQSVLSAKEYKGLPQDFDTLDRYIAEHGDAKDIHSALEAMDEIMVATIQMIGAYDRFTIPDVMPDGNPDVCRLNSLGKGGMKIPGDSDAFHYEGRMVQCLGGAQTTSGFTMSGVGRISFRDPKNNWRNFVSNVAVKQMENDFYRVFTVYPKDLIVARVGGGRDARVYIPNGRGSIFRFYGEVKNLFEGYTIVAKETDRPMSFLLHEEYGLTYISGLGSVLDSNGEMIFSAASN